MDSELRLQQATAATDSDVLAGLELALSSRRLANGILLVSARGEVDLYTAPDLERTLAEAVAEAPAQLVVDLSEASFVDSTALQVLLRAARQLAQQEGVLTVVVPDPTVRRVFEITGFDRVFPVVSSLPAVSV